MPETVTETACAKINVALHVLGRRDDGYHELDSIVSFADFGDWLTFGPSDRDTLEVEGPFAGVTPAGSDNIVMRALASMRELYAAHGTELPPVSVRLAKNLPIAAGIGGGSADAAATIRGLLRLTGNDLPKADLSQVALMLGADVPVCLQQVSCRMSGIGEEITSMTRDQGRAIVLVNPLRPLPTSDVFARLGLEPGQRFGTGIVDSKPETWRNDLTAPAVQLVPEISEIIEELVGDSTVIVARMSGSGATCFALTETLAAAELMAARIRISHPHWWTAAARLR